MTRKQPPAFRWCFNCGLETLSRNEGGVLICQDCGQPIRGWTEQLLRRERLDKVPKGG